MSFDSFSRVLVSIINLCNRFTRWNIKENIKNITICNYLVYKQSTKRCLKWKSLFENWTICVSLVVQNIRIRLLRIIICTYYLFLFFSNLTFWWIITDTYSIGIILIIILGVLLSFYLIYRNLWTLLMTLCIFVRKI